MKKLIVIKFVLSLISILFLMSCNEDFLEEVNPNQISTDSFWKNTDDLNAGLTAVYNVFKNNSVLSIGSEYNRSDMTYPGYGRPNTGNEYYLQNFNNASGTPNNKWRTLYTGIFRANQVIVAADNLIGTLESQELEERALLIKAQARFLRGLFYFYLHNSFNNGSVIIFDFVPEDENDFFQPLRPEEEVQDFYIADLEFALEHLPKKWEDNKDISRVTAGAALALLGKSALYDGNYQDATIYFKEIIDNYDYALTPNIGDSFTTRNEFNSESILEINYSLDYKIEISPWSEEQVSSNLHYTFSPKGGWRSVIPSCWLIMAYKNEVMDINDPRNYVTEEILNDEGEVIDTDTRLRSYSLRASQSIALVDDLDTEYYGLTTAQAASFNNHETAYFRKYTNWDIVENERDIIPNLRSGVNVRVIRLADIYLMYAESLIQGGANNGGVEEAMLYINKVRHRSALQLLGLDGTGEFVTADHDDIIYDAESLMQHLMYVERPLELSVEGNAIRTIDMRRWGITKARFQDLATRKYHDENFIFVNQEGGTGTKWGAVLVEGEKEDAFIYVDYAQAAQNYIEEVHGYWPIPNSEIVSNPALNN